MLAIIPDARARPTTVPRGPVAPNAPRPEGPDPPGDCTPEDVRAWLAAAFLILPDQPIYSASKGEITFNDPNVAPQTFDIAAFTRHVLGREAKERLWVLTQARVDAKTLVEKHSRRLIKTGRREALKDLLTPPGGGSIADFCAEQRPRLDRSTFDRTVRRAWSQIAAAWTDKKIQNLS